MTPQPKTSPAAPYRWVPSVNLDPKDVEALLHELPAGSPLVDQLQATARAAERLAGRLNKIEHGRAA
jgi:hypothetical protein